MKTLGQCGAKAAQKRKAAGQTMVEYILVFTVLAAVVAALAGFFAAERRSAARTVGLVASEYP